MYYYRTINILQIQQNDVLKAQLVDFITKPITFKGSIGIYLPFNRKRFYHRVMLSLRLFLTVLLN